jgi:hypothetical protein
LFGPTRCRRTIQSSRLPESSSLNERRAKISQLTRQYRAGDSSSPKAFRDLVDLLFRATVMKTMSVVQLNKVKDDSYVVACPPDQGRALPLNDGRYLRLVIALYFEDTDKGRRLKVKSSSYQYQEDLDGDRWIFRYDYLRNPPHPHPGDHLQIRGDLTEKDCLSKHCPLERVHFPTMRISLEAVIRLLADQFGVKCNRPKKEWRPMLAASEAAFLEIAHHSLSGPADE